MTVQQFSKQVTADTTITTTTETVVLTFPAISTPQAGTTVTLHWDVNVTWGTGTTAATARIRRGTDATGTLVNEADPLSYTAGSSYDTSGTAVDNPGEVAGQSYVLTLQATGASANSTCVFAGGTISLS